MCVPCSMYKEPDSVCLEIHVCGQASTEISQRENTRTASCLSLLSLHQMCPFSHCASLIPKPPSQFTVLDSRLIIRQRGLGQMSILLVQQKLCNFLGFSLLLFLLVKNYHELPGLNSSDVFGLSLEDLIICQYRLLSFHIFFKS